MESASIFEMSATLSTFARSNHPRNYLASTAHHRDSVKSINYKPLLIDELLHDK
jgi:hypothetical protein